MTAVCAACGAPTATEVEVCPRCGDSPSHGTAGIRLAPRQSARAGFLQEKTAAAFAYITLFPAVLFLVLRPYRESAFVRFHALQSIAVAVSSLALAALFLLLANVSAINLLLIPASFIVAIGIFLAVVVCIIKAYQHQAYKLPLLGDWAERLARRP